MAMEKTIDLRYLLSDHCGTKIFNAAQLMRAVRFGTVKYKDLPQAGKDMVDGELHKYYDEQLPPRLRSKKSSV